MKYLISILLGITAVTVGCSDKHPHSEQTTIVSPEDRIDENRAFRKQTFEKFINIGDSIIDKGESAYLQMLQAIMGKVNENDKRWYRQNVTHVDSISRYCIDLSDSGKEEELLNILSAELGNFQSHPVAKTDVCFDLNLILTNLYFSQAESHPDYLQKCIDLWEFSRIQINAVQSSWQEYHPLYIEVLNILSRLYEKVGNTQKVAEMQSLMNEVTTTKG